MVIDDAEGTRQEVGPLKGKSLAVLQPPKEEINYDFNMFRNHHLDDRPCSRACRLALI